MATVRHYTSSDGLTGIKNDMAINAARGNPVGVHVEVAPFGAASTGAQETGAFGSGAYIQFQVPQNSLVSTYVGPRSTAIIPTNNPLPLNGTNPTFVNIPWWRLW